MGHCLACEVLGSITSSGLQNEREREAGVRDKEKDYQRIVPFLLSRYYWLFAEALFIAHSL